MANLNRADDVQESLTSFFLSSISYERKINNEVKSQPLVNVIKEMFVKSGVSLHGVEAFRIHNELFTNIFIKRQNEYVCSILPQEFFCLLLDEEMNWLNYFLDVVFNLRFTDVNRFLHHLLTFVSNDQERTSYASDVKLLVLGLMLVNAIVLDLIHVPQIHINGETSAGKEKFEKEVQQFEKNSVQLTQLYIESLQLVLKLCNSDQCLVLAAIEVDTYNLFIHLACMALVLLDPRSLEIDVKQFLCSLHGGEIIAVEKEATAMVNKKVRMEGYVKLKKQIPQNPTVLGVCIAKVEELMQTKYDEIFSPIQTLLKCMKDQTMPSLFCDLLSFLCSVDKFLRPTMTSELNLRIGHHVLDGQRLTKHVLKIVKYYLSRSSNQSSNNLPDEFPTKVNRLSSESANENGRSSESANENVDLGKLGKSEIQVFVESSCHLSSRNDLDWLKAVVSNREPGWKDLLTFGFNNTDILHWWNKGFYDLVCLNESVLSTEPNVRLLFNICCEAQRHHRDLNIAALLQQLFKRMFHGLSGPLQEQVVLSIISRGESSEDFLHGQMPEKAILSELITLFNKLTSTNLNQVVSVMLYLCMYNPDLVIKQSVLVAIGNKAQVGLIVDVFRKFPSICKSFPPHLQYSRLIQACLDVLKACKIDSNITKNTAHFLTKLVQSYKFILDCNFNLMLEGLMTASDVIKYFLLPNLTNCLSTGHSAHAVETKELNTSFSLHILHCLLTTIEKSEVVKLQPFPLLAVIADLYVDSYFVFYNGQLDKKLLAIKQYSQMCIHHLTQLLADCTKYCSVSSFNWLKKYSLSSGWLHLALMKPTLEHCCDLELQSLLACLIRQQFFNAENCLGLLLHLACVTVVNDEMLTEVQHFLQHASLTSSQSIMLLLTKQMLLMCLPSEMQRLVKLIIVLVQSQELHISDVFSQSSTPSMFVSQLLSNAVVLLFSDVSCQSALCHLVNNYIAATQALTQDITMVTTLFCQHCAMLSQVTGRVTELLQMSALDLMMKLKSSSGPLSLDKSKLLDYAQCVTQKSIRNILVKHIEQ